MEAFMNKPTTLGFALFIVFGLLTSLSLSLEHGLLIGIPCGVIAGLFIALLYLLPLFLYRKKFLEIKTQLQGKISVILDGEANYYNYSPLGIGGWLFLTNNELIFKHYHTLLSKKWWKDKQLQTVIIPLASIERTELYKQGNVKRIILNLLDQQQAQIFAVYDHTLWLEKINEKLGIIN